MEDHTILIPGSVSRYLTLSMLKFSEFKKLDDPSNTSASPFFHLFSSNDFLHPSLAPNFYYYIRSFHYQLPQLHPLSFQDSLL